MKTETSPAVLTAKQNAQADWWARFLIMRRFPLTGHYFIAPDEDEPWCANLVHETGRKVDFMLDHGETWEQSRATFQAALYDATVSLPTCLDPNAAPRPDPRILNQAATSNPLEKPDEAG